MRRRSQRGSQFVEAALAMLPFTAMLFLVLDTGWGLWVKATLQHAVVEGMRYGVTGQAIPGQGQVASIQNIVVNQAMGLLNGFPAVSITVRFYTPSTLAATSSNASGNVLEVSIVGYPFSPFSSLLKSGAAVPLTLSAAGIIEPQTGAPPAL